MVDPVIARANRLWLAGLGLASAVVTIAFLLTATA